MDRAGDGGARVARRFRGCALVGLTALLTAVGHLAGGGAAPDLAPLAVLLPLLGWPVVAMADRCRGPLATTAVLGAGQLLLHELMVALHGHHHAAGSALSSAPPTDAAMVAAHAAATALIALALRHADRGLTAVGAALRRVVPRRPIAPPADRPLAVRAVPGPAVPVRIRRALAVTHVRRGPPVCC
jgi:hypothetical protein